MQSCTNFFVYITLDVLQYTPARRTLATRGNKKWPLSPFGTTRAAESRINMVANIASNVKNDESNLLLHRARLHPSPSPPLAEALAAGMLHIIDRLDRLGDALREDVRVSVGMDEAARRLGISRRLLDTLCAAGEVRSFKAGARRLIPVAALHDYVAARQREERR
jgi:excisionase family DNA binding protein